MSIVALATMSAAAAHSEATGARTSVSAHDGGSAWPPASRSPAPGVGAPSFPVNVGILDTTIHATRGPDPNTPTATVQPEPPTRNACANTGTKPESMNNSRTAWGARVRSLAAVRPLLFASRCRSRSFFVSKTFSFRFRSRVAVNADNRVSELKNELKSRVLLFFRAGYPPRG